MRALGSEPLAGGGLLGIPIARTFMAYILKNGSDDWEINYRTSEDFITWASAVVAPTVFSSGTGLDDTDEKRNLYAIQIGGDQDIWIFFEVVEDTQDQQELTNIWYITSPDYGLTWTTAVKLTSYDTFVAIGSHPTAVQKTQNTMYVVYNEVRGALTMDKNDAGWCGGANELSPTDTYWDSVSDKWYVTAVKDAGGDKILHAIIEIDLDTWAITDCWSTASVPAFDDFMDLENVWFNAYHSERPYIVIGNVGGGTDGIHPAVLNYVDDTITQYNFSDWSTYELVKNVNWSNHDQIRNIGSMAYSWIDAPSNRLYIGIVYESTTKIQIGYLDLTDTTEPYTFTDVIYDESFGDFFDIIYHTITHEGGFQVYPDNDWIIVCQHNQLGGVGGKDLIMKIYSLSSGNVVKEYGRLIDSNFPLYGIRRGFLLMTVGSEEVIYAGFLYTTLEGQTDNRGLFKLTISTDTIEYIRPTFATIDDYGIRNIIQIDAETIAMSTDFGIYMMNVNDESWTRLDNANVPGLTEDGNDVMSYPIQYDPSRGLILTGSSKSGNWNGATAVSRYGPLKKSYFIQGTNQNPWVFTTPSPLVQGINDFDAVLSVDPVTNGMYAFWTNDTLQELSIKWDYEQGNVNISEFLIRESDIVLERNIDGTPSRLSFTVSHGHLFDKHNINSIFGNVLEKFRKITLRFGEKSVGVEYWKNQGEFMVTETSVISYQRLNLPTMVVTCEDKSIGWDDNIVLATEAYGDTDPLVILDDVMQENTDFIPTTIDLPDALNNIKNLNYQWIETSVKDIVTQIANRFGYYPRIDMEGKFTLKEISDSDTISQSYLDASHIINFSPDDSFSDFTNQVIITGEELTWLEIVHNEERIAELSGTAGWWGGKETFTIYYSSDKNRTARFPRLEVKKTVASMAFKIAGIYGAEIEEGIEEEDINEHWVKVFVNVPNLAPQLIALLLGGALASAMSKGNINIHPPGTGGGVTQSIPVGRIVFGGLMKMALMILGSVVNYQYEIFAKPIGKVRRSIQAVADDTELQAALGYIVKKIYTDPLCNHVSSCQFVADWELMIAKLQRRRVTFTKVTNLLEEDGDTIRIVHPYTEEEIDILITKIKRRMNIAGESSQGYFLDDIEGWVLEL